MKKLLVGLVAAMACAGAYCETPKLYVKTGADGGSDETGDGSWEKPYATISNAVDKAIRDRIFPIVVSVQPGTYPGGTRMEYWNDAGKDSAWTAVRGAVQIRAQKRVGDEDVDNPNPRETIIDCQQKAAGAWLSGKGACICGFTITNGVWQRIWELQWSGSNIGGSGVYLRGGAMASNLVICCCLTRPDDRPLPTTSGDQYAAVAVEGAESTIVDSFIYNCTNETTSASLSGELNAAGIRLDAASARRCVISNCWSIAGKSSGNRRGGGVYMVQGSGATLDSCKVLDCGTLATDGGRCDGGGIYLLRGVTVTNCFVSGCYAKGWGGGIAAGYGCGLIVDTTITNCTSSGWGRGLCMSPSTEDPNQIVRRCRIAGCNDGIAVYQTYGTVEDCVIENNTSASDCVQVGGLNAVFRNNVIRNNKSSNGSALSFSLASVSTVTVEKCWFTGNTCGTGKAVLSRPRDWTMGGIFDGCVISGNVAGYGIESTDNTYWASENFQNWPEDERYPWTGIRNCTVANNTLNGSGIYLFHAPNGNLSGPQRVSVTNCLVAGNVNGNGVQVQSFSFDATMKEWLDGHPEQIAYCAMPTGTGNNLPADSSGVAHNQVGRVGVREGTMVPKGLALNNAYPLPEMMAPDATDIGDGTYEISKSADWGVHITANNVRPRVLGTMPDIGACECMMPGLLLLVK